MVTYGRATSNKDLEQILALQRKNLPNSISSEEKEREGFVTVSHTSEMLKEMNDVCAHIIARSCDTVIGYALCMHPKFGNEIEVLQPMFEQIEYILPGTRSYIVMGQICIDKAYRGKGVFRRLYTVMKDAIQSKFDCIVTEVDAENIRSLQAHYAVGFEDLKTYRSGGQVWKLIYLMT